MNEAFALFLGSQGGDAELANDYNPVRNLTSSNFNKVLPDVEVSELGV